MDPHPNNEEVAREAPGAPVGPSFPRILLGVVALLAALILCQDLCERAEGALTAMGFAAAGLLAVALLFVTRRQSLIGVFTSVRLAAALLACFAFACIASTLTLQQPGPLPRDEQGKGARYRNYLNAQAPFLFRLCYPFRTFKPELKPFYEQYLKVLGRKFGQDYERERRKEELRQAGLALEQDAVSTFAKDHAAAMEALYRLIRFTRMDRAYSAWWFRALSALILLNTLCCTAARYRFRRAQIGFLLTHGGLGIALVGAAIGSVCEQKGMIQFLAGKEGHDRVTSFLDSHSNKEVDLGFAVHATHFRTEYRNSIEVTFLDAPVEGSPHPVRVSRSYDRFHKGSRFLLDEGKLKITVADILPKAVFEDKLVSRSGEPKNPAVEFLAKSDGEPSFFRLYAHDPAQSRYLDAARNLTVRFTWFKDPSEVQAGIAAFANESPASLLAFTRDGTITLQPVAPGDKVRHGDYAIEVLECRGDRDKPGPGPLRKQDCPNPAARLKITAPDGKTEERWVLANTPHDKKDAGILVFLRWESPETTRYLVYGIGKGPLNLIKIAQSKAVGPTSLIKGQSLDTSGPGAGLFLADLALDASVTGVVPYIPPADADPVALAFEDPSDEAVTLRFEGEGFQETKTLLANSGEAGEYTRAGRFSVTFGTDAVREYRAYLRIEDKDDPSKVKKEQIVRVNQPLSYGGFTFYQESYDKKIPNYTGIKVKRDPGAGVAQLGLVLMAVGIVFAFFVKPALGSGK